MKIPFDIPGVVFALESGPEASAMAASVARTEVVEFGNCTVETWELPVMEKGRRKKKALGGIPWRRHTFFPCCVTQDNICLS